MSADLDSWLDRKHARSCERAAGTLGPDDIGCHAGCNCETWRERDLAELRKQAAKVHRKFDHPGLPEECESPHDVICKAVWS